MQKKVFILVLFLVFITSLAVAETVQSRESGNIYVDEEYGVSLVFPDDWFIVSGKQAREQKAREMDEKLLGKKSTSSMRDRLIKIAISTVPLVTAYKYNPDTRDDVDNPAILLTLRDTFGDYSLKTAKSELQLAVKYTKGKIIVPLEDIFINGLNGIGMAYEYQRESGLFTEFVYTFVKRAKEYSLTFKCDSEYFSEDRADFEKVINSFEIE